MTTLAQVLHVARKDAMAARRTLIIYGFIVLVATAHATGILAPSSDALDSLMLVVALFGGLQAGLAVQADSPNRADAFWATRPIRPEAMLGGKMLFTFFTVLALGLIGQAIALMAHGAPAPALPALLGDSLWRYARWLLVAMLLAATTRNLSSFFAVVVAIPVAVLVSLATFAAALQARPSDALPSGNMVVYASETIAVLALVAAPAALVYIYRTRDAKLRTRLAAGIAVLITLLSFDAALMPPKVSLPQPAATQPALHLDLLNGGRVEAEPKLDLVLRADGIERDQHVALIQPVAIINLRDGSTMRIPVQNMYPEIGYGMPNLPQGFAWVRNDPSRNFPLGFSVQLNADQRRRIAVGIDRLALEGTAQIRQARLAGTMAFTPGASFAGDGRRIFISKIATGFGDATSSIEISSLVSEEPLIAGANELEFILLNDAEHQALGLHRTQSSGQSGWLVIPGPGIQESVGQFETGTPFEPRSGIKMPDGWFRSARLGMVRWESRGTYNFNVQATTLPGGEPVNDQGTRSSLVPTPSRPSRR